MEFKENLVGDVGIENKKRWLRVRWYKKWDNKKIDLKRKRKRWSERLYKGIFYVCKELSRKFYEKNERL